MIRSSILQDIAFFVCVPAIIIIVCAIIFIEVEGMCEWRELVRQDAEREHHEHLIRLINAEREHHEEHHGQS